MDLTKTTAGLLLSGLISSSVLASPWNRSFSEVQDSPSREPDQEVRYGDVPGQDIEAWLPPSATGPAPLVFLVHGGCWLKAYDRSHLRPLAAALSERGYVVLLPEYRRVGQPGGGWPGTFEDIASAVDAIADLPIAEADKDNSVLVGHSAGGHLALWAAGRDRIEAGEALYRENPFMPRAVIGLAAITDLEDYAGGDNSCQRVTPELMGGGPAERPGRYAQASPVALGTSIPTVLLQGSADAIVPPDQARALPSAELRLIEGAGHFDLVHPATPAFQVLLAALDEVLGR
jgi:acetyl esterase/lipase